MEEKNRFLEVENQIVVLTTPSYWEQFKEWQKPYQVLLFSILTVIVIAIILAICLSVVGFDGKHFYCKIKDNIFPASHLSQSPWHSWYRKRNFRVSIIDFLKILHLVFQLKAQMDQHNHLQQPPYSQTQVIINRNILA